MTGISKVTVSSLPQLTRFSFSKALPWQGQGLEMLRGYGDSPLEGAGHMLTLGGSRHSRATLLVLLSSESFSVHGY